MKRIDNMAPPPISSYEKVTHKEQARTLKFELYYSWDFQEAQS